MENNAYKPNDDLKRLYRSNAWKNPCVKGNTYNYLSLLSQDKYNDSKKNASYDRNYYYPGTAGKDVNIFVIDGGFNFRNPEFSNTDERIVRCEFSASEFKIFNVTDEKFCMYGHDDYHGSQVAVAAGGKTLGAAPRANIFGVANKRFGNYTAAANVNALQYIKTEYLIREHDVDPTDSKREEKLAIGKKFVNKTVINISSNFVRILNDDENGFHYYDQKESDLFNHYGKLINQMIERGAIFVVSAANNIQNVDNYSYPCSYNNTICVGAIDNIGINEVAEMVDDVYYNPYRYPSYEEWNTELENAKSIYYKKIEELVDRKDMATKNYRIAHFSNYGEMVDIYAPGFVKTAYQDNDGNDIVTATDGTSFSSPLVAGVIATIISEFPYYNYTADTMLRYLKSIGIKDSIKGIPKGHPNLFINNGKHWTYSQTDEYNSCGNDNGICSKTPYMNELNCFDYGCCIKDGLPDL